MRTCFLHIGTYKTGTTSLQTVLTDHYGELQRRGYLYPTTGRLRSGPAHHNIPHELINSSSFNRENGTVDELIGEIRSSNHNVVLSSELFQTVVFHPQTAREFIRALQSCGLRVVIIVYLRNQIDYVRSFYLELLKYGFSQPFEEFLQTMLKESIWSWGATSASLYYSNLLNALEGISDGRIIVRSYDQLKAGSLISDFFSILGLDAGEIGIDLNPRLNASASILDSAMTFFQNRTGALMEPTQRRVIASLLAGLQGRTIGLSMRLRRKIIEQTAASNQHVFSKYAMPQFPSMTQSLGENDPADPFDDVICMEDIFSSGFHEFLHARIKALG